MEKIIIPNVIGEGGRNYNTPEPEETVVTPETSETGESRLEQLEGEIKEQTERIREAETLAKKGSGYSVKVRGEYQTSSAEEEKTLEAEIAKLRVLETEREKLKKSGVQKVEKKEPPVPKVPIQEESVENLNTKKISLETSITDLREQIKKAETEKDETKVTELENAIRKVEQDKIVVQKHLEYEIKREAKRVRLSDLEQQIKEQTEQVKKVEDSDEGAYKVELAKLRELEAQKKTTQDSIETKWKRGYVEQAGFEDKNILNKEFSEAMNRKDEDEKERVRLENEARANASDRAEADRLRREMERAREADRMREIELELSRTREVYAKAIVDYKGEEFLNLNWITRKFTKVDFTETVPEILAKSVPEKMNSFRDALRGAMTEYYHSVDKKVLSLDPTARREYGVREREALQNEILKLIADGKYKESAREILGTFVANS